MIWILISRVYLIEKVQEDQLYKTYQGQALSPKNPFKIRTNVKKEYPLIAFVSYPRFQSILTIKIGQTTCQIDFQSKLCFFKNEVEQVQIEVRCGSYPCKIALSVGNIRSVSLSQVKGLTHLIEVPSSNFKQVFNLDVDSSNLIQQLQSSVRTHSQLKPLQSIRNQDHLTLIFPPASESFHILVLNYSSQLESSVRMQLFRKEKEESFALKEDGLKTGEMMLLDQQKFKVAGQIQKKYRFLYFRFQINLLKQRKTPFLLNITLAATNYEFQVDFELLRDEYIVVVPRPEKSQPMQVQMKSSVNFFFILRVDLSQSLIVQVNKYLCSSSSGNYSILFPQNHQRKSIQAISIRNDSKLKVEPSDCTLNCKVEFNIPADRVACLVIEQSKVQVDYMTKLAKGQKNQYFNLSDHQWVYFIYNNSVHQELQLVLNSDSLVAYVSFSKDCKRPNLQCHDVSGNIHQPVYITAQLAKNELIMIGIYASHSVKGSYQLTSPTYSEINMRVGQDKVLSIKNEVRLAFQLVKGAKNLEVLLYAPPNKYLMQLIHQQRQILSQSNIISFSQPKLGKYKLKIMKRKGEKDFSQRVKVLVNIDKIKLFLSSEKMQRSRIESGSIQQFSLTLSKEKLTFINFIMDSDQTVLKVTFKNKIFNVRNGNNTIDLSFFSPPKECSSSSFEEHCQFILSVQLQSEDLEQSFFSVIAYFENSVVQLSLGYWHQFSISKLSETSRFYFYMDKYVKPSIFISAVCGCFAVKAKLYSASVSLPKEEWPFPTFDSEKSQLSTSYLLSFSKQQIDKQCKQYECFVLISIYRQLKVETMFSFSDLLILPNSQTLQLKQGLSVRFKLQSNQKKVSSYPLRFGDSGIEIKCQSLTGQASCLISIVSNEHPDLTDQTVYFQQHIRLQINQLKNLLVKQNISQKDHDIQLLVVTQGVMQSNMEVMVKEVKDQFYLLQGGRSVSFKIQKQTVFYFDNKVKPRQVQILAVQGNANITFKLCKEPLSNCILKTPPSLTKYLKDRVNIDLRLIESPYYALLIYNLTLSTKIKINLFSASIPFLLLDNQPITQFLTDQSASFVGFGGQDKNSKVVLKIFNGELELSSEGLISVYNSPSLKVYQSNNYYGYSEEVYFSIQCKGSTHFSLYYQQTQISLLVTPGQLFPVLVDKQRPNELIQYRPINFTQISSVLLQFESVQAFQKSQIRIFQFHMQQDIQKKQQFFVKNASSVGLGTGPLVLYFDLPAERYFDLQINYEDPSQERVDIVFSNNNSINLPLQYQLHDKLFSIRHFQIFNTLPKRRYLIKIKLCSDSLIKVFSTGQEFQVGSDKEQIIEVLADSDQLFISLSNNQYFDIYYSIQIVQKQNFVEPPNVKLQTQIQTFLSYKGLSQYKIKVMDQCIGLCNYTIIFSKDQQSLFSAARCPSVNYFYPLLQKKQLSPTQNQMQYSVSTNQTFFYYTIVLNQQPGKIFKIKQIGKFNFFNQLVTILKYLLLVFSLICLYVTLCKGQNRVRVQDNQTSQLAHLGSERPLQASE